MAASSSDSKMNRSGAGRYPGGETAVYLTDRATYTERIVLTTRTLYKIVGFSNARRKRTALL